MQRSLSRRSQFAPALTALAQAIDVPAADLSATVAAFNEGARGHVDEAFGCTVDSYQRHLGVGDHRPNPSVAPINSAPFFAVAVRPAVLCKVADLVAYAQTRVLSPNGRRIPGLCAWGNDMQSVMNGA